MIGIRRLPRRARGFLVVAAAWAITAVAGLVIAGTVTGSGPASARPAQYTGGVRNPVGWNGNLYPLGPPGLHGAPGLLGAEKTTVAGAQAKAGYPVPVPATAAASRANLTQVWVAPQDNRQAALVFDNGKVNILMNPETYQGALHFFRAFIAENAKNGGVTAAIGQVNRRPALVIWPEAPVTASSRGAGRWSRTHSNPAVVNFWRNGILIRIFSNTKTYGTDTLLAIARSMR